MGTTSISKTNLTSRGRSCYLVGEPFCMKPACPHCGSKDTRPSHMDNWVSKFMGLLGLSPYRCRSCLKRFFRWPDSVAAEKTKKKEKEAPPRE